ncbi:MAG: GIY-YIG nuclease family protein [bacterium]|nr:GIY-YIG nuclease family protein [bacterium]
MWVVYILQSEKDGSYYVGSTGNLEDRINRHNCKRSLATKYKTPWKLVYKETLETRRDAVRREKQIKKQHSHKYIEQLINQQICV